MLPKLPSWMNSLIHAGIQGAWVDLGDFNITRGPEERSNDNFNAGEAALFNEAIDDIELVEVLLQDQRFTWSNRQNSHSCQA